MPTIFVANGCDGCKYCGGCMAHRHGLDGLGGDVSGGVVTSASGG